MTRTGRLLGTLLAAVVLVALPPVSPPASAVSTYLCTGYDRCKDAGYSHFGYKGAGKKMWWRMFSGHNCTNYVAYRLVKRGMSAARPWDSTGMAYNWGRANRSKTDQTPMVGSVAWWNANSGGVGSSGHVAYVQQVISNSKIVISEDSWSGDFHWRRITKGSGSWPSGFIHFRDESLAVRTRPAITGTPAVGRRLTVSSGTWSQAATYGYQWYADGAPVAGATTSALTLTPGLLGKRLTARVQATKRGYATGTSTTDETARVARGTMRSTSAPTVTGTPRVDEVLNVAPGDWSPAPSRTTIRWYADGVAIPGATYPNLRLRQEHIRQRITAHVTAWRDGYRASKTESVTTGPVAAGRIDVTAPFVLAGTPRLGRTLSIDGGRFDPAEAEKTYTWLRNGRPIAGATGRTYELVLADVGRRISAQVGLSHTGYRDLAVPLSTDRVVTTVPTLRVTATGKPGRAVVRVRVSAPGVTAPGGRLTVKLGGREAPGRVVDGLARVVVDDVAAGLRTVKVFYDGTSAILPGKARTTVRVTKK